MIASFANFANNYFITWVWWTNREFSDFYTTYDNEISKNENYCSHCSIYESYYKWQFSIKIMV